MSSCATWCCAVDLVIWHDCNCPQTVSRFGVCCMCYISVLFVVLVIIAKKKKNNNCSFKETSDLNDKPANGAVCPRAAKHAAEPKGLAPSTAAPGGAAATRRPLAGAAPPPPAHPAADPLALTSTLLAAAPLSEPNGVRAGRSAGGGGWGNVCALRPKAGAGLGAQAVCPGTGERAGAGGSGRAGAWGSVCVYGHTPRCFPAQTCNRHVSSRKQDKREKSRNKIGKTPARRLLVFPGAGWQVGHFGQRGWVLLWRGPPRAPWGVAGCLPASLASTR